MYLRIVKDQIQKITISKSKSILEFLLKVVDVLGLSIVLVLTTRLKMMMYNLKMH